MQTLILQFFLVEMFDEGGVLDDRAGDPSVLLRAISFPVDDVSEAMTLVMQAG